jgi:hypothetical protein
VVARFRVGWGREMMAALSERHGGVPPTLFDKLDRRLVKTLQGYRPGTP